LPALPKRDSYINIDDLKRRISLYEDEAAYKELFFHLFPSLTRFSESILKSKEVAEELVSDVFISVWNDRTRLQEIDDFRLYLFVAVRNNSLRKLKQISRRYTLSLDELELPAGSVDQSPEDHVLSRETVQEIEAAIESLPPRARLIFKLAKEDHLRYKEIAKLLNISVKTVDHQLAISLKKIAQSLGALARKKNKKNS
jgi:RNA polymerase sigma-70 factor (ECF subfamily)